MVPDILKDKKLAELREIGAALKIENAAKLKKSELLEILTKMHEEAEAQGAVSEEKTETEKKKTVRKKSVKKEEIPEAPDEKEEEVNSPEPEEKETPSENAAEASEEQTEEKEQEDNRFETTGILDLAEAGFGFLRFDNFLTSDRDIYVSPAQIRRFNLKTGDEICCIARKPGVGERFGALLYVKTVNGDEPGVARNRKDFSMLTPVFPNERINLEKGSSVLSMRLVDLVAPIGKGQRGLIVAPPKAGKTTLLKQIAHAIEA